jgi:hypothetical protein
MTKARGQQVRMPPRREEIDWQDRTTVMVRNIPAVYTQRELLTELDARGWKGTYDFFYLPFDLNKKQNMGYCFMNFKDPSLAEACHVALDGAQLARGEGRGRKRLQIVPAVTQGYQANLEHFQHSAVLNHHRQEHGPVFLRDENAPMARRRETRSQPTLESRLETPPRMLPRPPLTQPPTLPQPPPTLPQTLPQPPPTHLPTQPPPPLESLLPSAITTLSLSPIPPGFSQPMMYVELCRIGVGYLVDFLHLDHFAHEAIVNLTSPQAAVAAAQVLSGISLGGSAPLMVGIARVQGCGANIVHYATRGILAEEAKKAQKDNQKILKPVARSTVKSYEYTCPAFDMTAQPPTTASASTEVSDEDEAQKICEPVAQRVKDVAPHFASLGITLDEGAAAAETLAATDSAAPAQVRSVASTLTPPRTAVQPGKDEPQVSQRRAVHADMERALHAGFPSLLSSPACNLMPSSRGSSSESRLPRSATPPLSGPQSQCGTSPQCDSNAQDSNAHDAGSGGTATPPAPTASVAVSKTTRSGLPPRPVATSS